MLGRGAAWGCCSQSSLAVYGALTLSGRAEFSQHCCSLRMSFLTKGLLLHYYWGELKLHFAGLVLIKMCTFSFPRERERERVQLGTQGAVALWAGHNHHHADMGTTAGINVCVCPQGVFGASFGSKLSRELGLSCSGYSGDYCGCEAALNSWEWLMPQCMGWVRRGGNGRNESLLSGKVGSFTSLWVISIILVLLCNEQCAYRGEQIRE